MLMRAWEQADPDSPADGLCDPALVDGAQARLGAALDAPHLGGVFGEEVEVLGAQKDSWLG